MDADLSGYFDSIPHGPLLKSVSRRISDGHVLALVKRWLEAPVEETDARGHTQRTTRNRDAHRGTPQGGVLSPLLANLYMRRFVLGWKVLGHEQRLDAQIVNYADDFVICCRDQAAAAMVAMRAMMSKLGLTVNEAKTRLCRVPDEEFNFLGYTFGRNYSLRTGRSYSGPRPSAKSVRALLDEISEQTRRSWVWLDVDEMVGRLNRKLRGWAAYFSQGRVHAAYRQVQAHTCWRLRQWLGKKYRVQGSGRSRYSDCYLREELGLVWLSALRFPRLLWANV